MECHFRLNDFNCALCYTLFLCDETNSSNAAVCVNICGFQARSITSSRWSQGRSTLSGSRMILIASCTTPGTPSHGNQRHNVFSNVQSFTANTTYIYIYLYIYKYPYRSANVAFMGTQSTNIVKINSINISSMIIVAELWVNDTLLL